MATLPGYWQEKQRKQQKPISGQAVSPYSAPVEPTGGTAPMGGGSSSSAPSAPKASPGGGTGFVSFGQYFGGNAPAVQAQAQKQAVSAKGFEELNALQKSGGMQGGAFDTLLGGGETKREAAKQGQYRFQQLASRLGEGVDTPLQAQGIAARQKEEAYGQWVSNQPTQLRYNNTPEELRAMFEDEWKAGTYTEKTPAMVSTPGSSL
jgi:hypothetical protein